MNAPTHQVEIHKLKTMFVHDEHDKRVPVASFWEKHPAILVFVRHWACIACRGHVHDIWQNRTKYEATGAKLVFIGNGAPHVMPMFRSEIGCFDAPLYTDPSLETYRACGFNRGFKALVNLKTLKNMSDLAAKGHSSGNHLRSGNGSLWQMGGIVAVKPGNIVTYQYISEALGDYPPEPDLKDTPWISSAS